MSNVAIRADKLSKSYRLVHSTGLGRYKTLRDDLARAARAPFRRLHRWATGAPDPRRETFWALNDVSFEIKEGEVVGVIGRNGAGKSTLLKILSRITEPTRGEAEIYGRVGSLLEVGTGFHPELTGRENIYLSGAILGMTRKEVTRKFDEIVAFAEVEKFLDTPAKHYSSGMYVRLAFAVAAHLEPEILIVDEVLAVGDAQFQKKCLGKMGEVARQGRTVLFVSHNMASIRKLCGRVLMLQSGRITADGLSDDIVNRYLGEVSNGRYVQKWADERLAPSNSVARIWQIVVRGDNGQLLDQIDTDTPFNIEIEYEVTKIGASVGLTVVLSDSDNNIIFSSINNHEPNWYGRPMAMGRYVSRCRIPGSWLNNAWFNVGINLFNYGYTEFVAASEVLRIEVSDGVQVSSDYHAGYGGLLRPMLEWSTKKTD